MNLFERAGKLQLKWLVLPVLVVVAMSFVAGRLTHKVQSDQNVVEVIDPKEMIFYRVSDGDIGVHEGKTVLFATFTPAYSKQAVRIWASLKSGARVPLLFVVGKQHMRTSAVLINESETLVGLSFENAGEAKEFKTFVGWPLEERI